MTNFEEVTISLSVEQLASLGNAMGDYIITNIEKKGLEEVKIYLAGTPKETYNERVCEGTEPSEHEKNLREFIKAVTDVINFGGVIKDAPVEVKLSEEDVSAVADKVVEKMVATYASTLSTPQEKIVLDKGSLVAFNGEEDIFILKEDGTLKTNGGTLSNVPKIPSARSSKEKVLKQAKEKYNNDIKEIALEIERAVVNGELSKDVFYSYTEEHTSALEAIFKEKGYRTNIRRDRDVSSNPLLTKYTLNLNWG